MKNKKISNQPLKGYADWYPEEFKVRKYIFDTWREVCESFGYQEYLTPLMESAEVYKAKSGEDVGGKELMTCIDRGGRELAVRPEMTPSVTRMITQIYKSEPKPIRYFSIANFVRNQKPQRGRNREFWQLNYDIFGVEEVEADIETLQVALEIMLKFNPPKDSFVLYLNNRKLIDYLFYEEVELTEDQKVEVVRILDKWAKLSREEFTKRLIEVGVSSEQVKKLVKFMESDSAKELVSNFPKVGESRAFKRTVETRNALEQFGYGDWIEFNPSIIRGFDYYDGIVFEVFDKHKDNNRSMFGGGRYNGLASIFGMEAFPSVGCAPGDETTKLFLESWNLIPDLSQGNKVLLPKLSDDYVQEYNRIAQQLREDGYVVVQGFEDVGVSEAFRRANKESYDYVALYGSREAEEGVVTLKNMDSGETEKVEVE